MCPPCAGRGAAARWISMAAQSSAPGAWAGAPLSRRPFTLGAPASCWLFANPPATGAPAESSRRYSPARARVRLFRAMLRTESLGLRHSIHSSARWVTRWQWAMRAPCSSRGVPPGAWPFRPGDNGSLPVSAAARGLIHAAQAPPLGLGQQQVGVPEALEGIEPGIRGLALGLHGLRLGEAFPGRRALPRLVEGVGVFGAAGHPPKPISAPVGEPHRALGVRGGRRHPPQGEFQFAQVSGADRGVVPVLPARRADPSPPAWVR